MSMFLLFSVCEAKAFERGIGSWLKLETVEWGRHRAGFNRSLKTWSVPERLKFDMRATRICSTSSKVRCDKCFILSHLQV